MSREQAWEALAVVERIKPLLAGLKPEVQGAALANLLAIFLAGHPPEVRETILALHIEVARELIPIAEAEIGMVWHDA